jgi:Helix-turn-helix domain
MGLVWTSTMKDATEVAVLGCLASHANDAGESCFAGIPRIARLVRRSERTVQRTIDSLEKSGWLTVKRGDGSGNLTQYEISVEKLQGCQDVTLLKKSRRVTSAQKRVTPLLQKGDIRVIAISEGNVKETKASNTPLPPSLRDGGDREPRDEEAAPDRLIDAALKRVTDKLGVTAARAKRKLRAVMKQRMDLEELPEKIADRMIAMYEKQAVNSRLLFRVAPLIEFFETGLWLDMNRWNWDQRAVREEQLLAEARTGSR